VLLDCFLTSASPAGSLASSQRRQLVKTPTGISHVTLLLPVVLYVLCGRLLIARLSSFPRQPSAEPLCPPLTRLATVLRRPDRERGADFYILSLLGVLDLFRFLMCCFARLRPALCAFTVFNPLRNAGPWLRTTLMFCDPGIFCCCNPLALPCDVRIVSCSLGARS
jgi:hypothetical protein